MSGQGTKHKEKHVQLKHLTKSNSTNFFILVFFFASLHEEMETSQSFQYLMAESGPADHAEGQGRDPRRLPPHLSTAGLLKTSLPFGITPEGQSTVRHLPHKAAHRISELNLFLYLRISGVSLCGLVLVGFTLTTEPFRVGSCLMASGLIPSQENPTETQDT